MPRGIYTRNKHSEITIECLNCGIIFQVPYKERHGKFCSVSCSVSYRDPWNKNKTKENNESIANISKKLIGRVLNEEHCHNISLSLIGRKYSDEAKHNMSLGRKGMKLTDKHKHSLSLSHIGHPSYNTCGSGKTGRRMDLNNQFFRSTYEANFVRILNYLRIEWE